MMNGKPYAYAVVGVTDSGKDCREIACYFDRLDQAASYLKCTRDWGWLCKLFRLKHEVVEDASVDRQVKK